MMDKKESGSELEAEGIGGNINTGQLRMISN